MTARERLVADDAVARLHARDASLFSGDPAVQDSIRQRLGWVELAASGRTALGRITALAEELADEGLTDVVLLGMGGSSLASLVISRVLGGARKLHVLDTTAPRDVRDALHSLDPARTAYVVASKSGGTIEPNTLYAVFRDHADREIGRAAAGRRFVAITDPGTVLDALADSEGFRATFHAPADVGGRFSALTLFGLVPAALAGVDAAALLDRAAAAEVACAAPPAENPAVELASFIADSHSAGSDKLTVVTSAPVRSFGLWVEQLVAESLGKQGIGVVPVVELSDSPRGYGPDRAIVSVRLTGDLRLAEWTQAQRGKHPVFEIVLDDALDLAEEFVTWETAVALSGVVLGVNPFDEPNVAEAKSATAAVLGGAAEVPGAQHVLDGISVTFAGGLPNPAHREPALAASIGHAIGALTPGDYLAILAYLPNDEELLAPLAEAVPAASAQIGASVCLETGPRYLHSTGQLHKGGPNTGVFIVVTTRDIVDIEVPGESWSLGQLHRAQAEGDLVTLAAHDRRVLRIDLPDASPTSVRRLAAALSDGAGVVREDRG